jgi:CBS domain-containing protein
MAVVAAQQASGRQAMKAKDIMTTPVVTVSPDTSVRDIAKLLFERRISGVPVVDKGQLVGIVTEGDLLHRYEIETDERPLRGSWWLRLIASDESPGEYIRSHARLAKDIMTQDVITVDEETPISKIAMIFETRRIKRVPVLRDGQLVGIVSRANLVQALATKSPSVIAATAQSDDAIREQLLAELGHRSWWKSFITNLIVMDGVVHYWGLFGSEDERTAARVAAENIPGVRRVEDHRIRVGEYPTYR